MARDKGTANVGFKFEPRTASPLDARQVVDYVSDLTDIETWKSDNGNYYYYEGMNVYVKENKKKYTLTSDNPANINNWKQDGSNGSSDDHVELTQAQYDALTEAEKMNGKVYFITDATGGGSGSGTVTTDVEAGWNLDKTGNMLSVNRQVPSITVEQDSAQVSIKAVKENGNAEELRLKTYPNDGYTGLYTGNDDDPNVTSVTAALQHKIGAGRNIEIGADGKTIGVAKAVPGLYYAGDGKYATIRNGSGQNGEPLREVSFNANTNTGYIEFGINDGTNRTARRLQTQIFAGRNLAIKDDGQTVEVAFSVPNLYFSNSNKYATIRNISGNSGRPLQELSFDTNRTGFVDMVIADGENTAVKKPLQEKISAGSGIQIGADGKTVSVAQSVLNDIDYLKSNPAMQAYTTNENSVGRFGTEAVYGKTYVIDLNQLSWSKQGINRHQSASYSLNEKMIRIIDYNAMYVYVSNNNLTQYIYEKWDRSPDTVTATDSFSSYARGLRFNIITATRATTVSFFRCGLPNDSSVLHRVYLTVYYTKES